MDAGPSEAELQHLQPPSWYQSFKRQPEEKKMRMTALQQTWDVVYVIMSEKPPYLQIESDDLFILTN